VSEWTAFLEAHGHSLALAATKIHGFMASEFSIACDISVHQRQLAVSSA
jgi:hypothetical protein